MTRDLAPSTRSEVENYKSATCPGARPYVETQIKEELANGRYVTTSTIPRIVSAPGAIPKNTTRTKFRIIHDASRPYGSALNDFADPDPFKYQSLQDAIDKIKPGYFLAKIDLQNSFRSVGISPNNYEATGLKWRFRGDNNDTYMIDTRVCFGGRRSPAIFNELSQAVLSIMRSRGFSDIVCYCDDFLVISKSQSECLHVMLELMQVLRRLGFSINYNRVYGPSQTLVFLGIELNTVEMTVALPKEKMNEIRDCLVNVCSQSKITKRGLQSLVGKLSWATQVIYGGRFHLRRLLDRIAGLRYPSHRTRLTQDMRADMVWWINFMQVFNGRTYMVDSRPTAPLTIDACRTAGGIHFMGHSLYTPWAQCWPDAAPLHINHKEVLALEPAAITFAPLWANKTIYVHCDNRSAVYVINKGISKHPLVMASLRRVFWLSAVYNFRLKAVHYPGAYNTLADSVSRLHEAGGYQRFCANLLQTAFLPCQQFPWIYLFSLQTPLQWPNSINRLTARSSPSCSRHMPAVPTVPTERTVAPTSPFVRLWAWRRSQRKLQPSVYMPLSWPGRSNTPVLNNIWISYAFCI